MESCNLISLSLSGAGWLHCCRVESVKPTHLQRKASHAHNPIWRKCAVNSLDQWGALGCYKWAIIALKYLPTKVFILCFDSWDKIQPMSSKVRNRETVNERRVRFIFRTSLLSHKQDFIFVSAEINFKGCIINVMEGFRTSIRIPSSLLLRSVRAPIKNDQKSNELIY